MSKGTRETSKEDLSRSEVTHSIITVTLLEFNYDFNHSMILILSKVALIKAYVFDYFHWIFGLVNIFVTLDQKLNSYPGPD